MKRYQKTPPYLNPIVIRIVGLLAPPAMANNGIALTQRALAQDRSAACLGPVGLEVVLSR